MASSVSILNNYDGQLFSFANKDLLMQGLMMREGQYAENKAKLKLTANQLMGIDISEERPQDQEYLLGRIKDFETVLKNNINSDLSNDYLVDQLVGRADEVIDENVENAVNSTYTRKVEIGKINQLKAEGKYSDINFSVYNDKWNQYIENENVGAIYSGSTYVPYVDLNKRLTSKSSLEKMKMLGFNEEFIGSVQKEGMYTAINKYKGTNEDRIPALKAFIEAEIGEDGRQQIAVEAVYNYGYGDNAEKVENLRQASKEYYDEVSTNLKGRIDGINSILNMSSISQNDRNKYIKAKQELEEQLNGLDEHNFDIALNDGSGKIDRNKYMSLAGNLTAKATKDRLFGLTYIHPIWTDKKLDEVQAKNVEYQKWSAEFGLKQKEHDLDILKYSLDVKKFEAEQGGGADVSNVNPSNVSLGGVTAVDTEKDKDIDVVGMASKERDNVIGEFRATLPNGGRDWSKAKTKEVMDMLQSVENPVDLVGKTIKLTNGDDYEFNASNIKALIKMKDISVGKGDVSAGIVNAINNVMGWGSSSSFFDSERVVMKGANPMKNLNVIAIKDPNTGKFSFEKGVLKGAEGGSNFKLLMYKKMKGLPMTETDIATLDFYKLTAAKNNNSGIIDGKENIFLEQSFNNVYGNVAGGQANGLAYSYYNNMSVKNDERVGGFGQYEVKNGRINPVGGMAYGAYKDNMSNIILNSGALIDLKKEHIEKVQKTFNLKDININYADPKKNGTGALIYKSILGQGDNVKADFKGGFKLTPMNDGSGKFDNKFTVSLEQTTKKDGVETTTYIPLTNNGEAVTVNRDFLTGIGVAIKKTIDTPYNSDFGSQASSFKTTPHRKSGFYGDINAPIGSVGYYSPSVNQRLKQFEQRIREETNNPNYNIYTDLKENGGASASGLFELTTGGIKGGDYLMYTYDSKGKPIPILNSDGSGNTTGMKSLSYDYLNNVSLEGSGVMGVSSILSFLTSKYSDVNFR